jgi:hypothetical protein
MTQGSIVTLQQTLRDAGRSQERWKGATSGRVSHTDHVALDRTLSDERASMETAGGWTRKTRAGCHGVMTR